MIRTFHSELVINCDSFRALLVTCCHGTILVQPSCDSQEIDIILVAIQIASASGNAALYKISFLCDYPDWSC